MMHYFEEYVINAKIGSGRYGEVYDVTDRRDPNAEPLALKILFLLPEGDFRVQQVMERFKREQKAARELRHHGLVRFHEARQAADGRHYSVTSLAPGRSLDRELQRGGFGWQKAMIVIKNLAETLDYLHSHKVVHRDIKPSNIVVTPEGQTTIVDLGVALFLDMPFITLSTQMVGTPSYMAPEILKQETATPATDVYALGCVLYEMLLGYPLFTMDNEKQAYYLHVQRGAHLPKAWPPDVPVNLNQVLAGAVSKDPKQRYQSAGEFYQALRALEKGRILRPRKQTQPMQGLDKHVWLNYSSVREVHRLVYKHPHLWAATAGGVFRLDTHRRRGWRYTTADGLPSQNVHDLHIDQVGRIWAATSNGVCYFDDQNTWHTGGSEALSSGAGVRGVCTEPDGSVWCACDNGVFYWDHYWVGKGFTAESGVDLKESTCVAITRERVVWVGTSHGAYIYDGKKWQRPLDDPTSRMAVFSIRIDLTTGAVWLATSQGVYRYWGQRWNHFLPIEGGESTRNYDLALDNAGNAWVAMKQSLARITGNRCESIPHNFTPVPVVRSLTFGVNDALWIGTTDGLYIHEPPNTYPVSEEFGLLDNMVYCIYEESSDNTWFGTRSGVSVSLSSSTPDRGSGWRSLSEKNKLLGPVTAITEAPTGTLWLATEFNGLYQCKPDLSGYTLENFNTRRGDLPSDNITSLLSTTSRELWVGTQNGIVIWNGSRWHRLSQLVGVSVNCMVEGDCDGLIWVGTNREGLYMWNNGQLTRENAPTRDVRSLACNSQDGMLWLTTERGLWVRTPEGGFQRAIVPPITGADVHCVCADRSGYIWIGSDRGIICTNGKDYHKVYTTKDGLAGNRVNTIFQTQEGCLWFATTEGASKLA